jgi:hypothetical protein
MHITEIVKHEQVSDEAIAVTVRCCSNPKTDSTFTIYGVHAMSPEQLQAKVDAHHDRVASKCHGMGAGKSLLSTLSKKPKTHEVL